MVLARRSSDGIYASMLHFAQVACNQIEKIMTATTTPDESKPKREPSKPSHLLGEGTIQCKTGEKLELSFRKERADAEYPDLHPGNATAHDHLGCGPFSFRPGLRTRCAPSIPRAKALRVQERITYRRPALG